MYYIVQGTCCIEKWIVFGTGDGIGHLAVPLAVRIGANVFAMDSGEDGVAPARRVGAEVPWKDTMDTYLAIYLHSRSDLGGGLWRTTTL